MWLYSIEGSHGLTGDFVDIDILDGTYQLRSSTIHSAVVNYTRNSHYVNKLMLLVLYLYLLSLTGQDEHFVIGCQWSTVFVPGEGRRGDGVGLTVEREWVVEYHLFRLPPAAGVRDGITRSSRSVETGRH